MKSEESKLKQSDINNIWNYDLKKSFRKIFWLYVLKDSIGAWEKNLETSTPKYIPVKLLDYKDKEKSQDLLAKKLEQFMIIIIRLASYFSNTI